MEGPPSKRTRCDELLVTLQDFQRVQAAQLHSMHTLLQQASRTPAVQVRPAPSLEDTFTSFMLAYKALNPLERQMRMSAIKNNITDETASLMSEITAFFGIQSESEISATVSPDSSEVEGCDTTYLSWYPEACLSESGFFDSRQNNAAQVRISPQEGTFLRACSFHFLLSLDIKLICV